MKNSDVILWSLWKASSKETLNESEFRELVPEFKNDEQMQQIFYEKWIETGTFPKDLKDLKYLLDRLQDSKPQRVGRIAAKI